MTERKHKWQRKFIKDVFSLSSDRKKNFSQIVLKNLGLIESKNDYLPQYLFKYYSPTSNNILDIRNEKLWLSHPTNFNDPFDCNIGYDREKHEKKSLLKFIKETGCVERDTENGFTIEEQDVIQRSYLGETNYWRINSDNYDSVKRNIFSLKSKDYRGIIDIYLRDSMNQIDHKIDKLKESNIRVSCFSDLDEYEEFDKQILMWSHYADNHRGFCVKYDLESLSEKIQFTVGPDAFYREKDKFIEERNKAIVKAGLFPVEYSPNRVNIPVSKLDGAIFDNNGVLQYNNNIDELIYKTYIVKSSKWSYEKEWRLIVDQRVSNFFNNKIPFPYAKTIFLGCRASDDLVENMINIGKDINAEVRLMKIDGEKFSLESMSTWSHDFSNEKRQWNNPFDFY